MSSTAAGPSSPSPLHGRLAALGGMVTDHAVLIRHDDIGTQGERIDGQPKGASPTSCNGAILTRRVSSATMQVEEEHILVVPASTARYQMTPAQGLLS